MFSSHPRSIVGLTDAPALPPSGNDLRDEAMLARMSSSSPASTLMPAFVRRPGLAECRTVVVAVVSGSGFFHRAPRILDGLDGGCVSWVTNVSSIMVGYLG